MVENSEEYSPICSREWGLCNKVLDVIHWTISFAILKNHWSYCYSDDRMPQLATSISKKIKIGLRH